jgi:hypothetical protein
MGGIGRVGRMGRSREGGVTIRGTRDWLDGRAFFLIQWTIYCVRNGRDVICPDRRMSPQQRTCHPVVTFAVF